MWKNVWNPVIYNCENAKYFANIMDNLAIMSDEVIESYNEETIFNEKKATCKTQNFYITLSILKISDKSIIDSCSYLLLFDKILSNTKTFIRISLHKQKNENINKKWVKKSKM